MRKTINIFKRKQNENYSQFLEQDLAGLKNAIAPSIMKEHPTYVQLGSNFVRTLAVLAYPTKVMGNWLSELYRFKGNVSVSFHLKPDMNSKMVKHISDSIQELDARLNPVKGKPSPQRERDLLNKKKSAERILDNLMQGNTNSVYYVHLYIHITASSLEDLEELTENVYNTLYTIDLKAAAPFDNMLHAFQSVLPVMENNVAEWSQQNMDIEAVSSTMPFDESTIFEESGIIKGNNLTDGGGSLVIVNQHKLKGHNEFVLGMTGAGKSFYMKKDILRYFAIGTQIYIIDPEREYSGIVKQRGGQVIVMSSMSDAVINPFEILHSAIDVVESEDNGKEVISKSLLHQKLVRLKTFFKLIKKDLSPLEAAILEDLLIQVYEDKEIYWNTDFSKLDSEKYPVLEDLYLKIDKVKERRLKDFQAILKTYVYGSNSLMFNGPTNVKLDAEIISFDLKDMEEEQDSQAAAMFNVLSYLWDEITRDKTQWKRLYVDEAHVLADHPRAMKFLFNIYKRIRKYKGGCTAATQQIADFLSAVEGKRNYGKAIIGNSQTKLLLSMQPSDIKDLEDHNIVRLSSKEKELLETDAQGVGLFIVGKKRVEIEIDFTKKELELIDPKQYEMLYGSGKSTDDEENDILEELNLLEMSEHGYKGLDEYKHEDEDDHDYNYESSHVSVYAHERDHAHEDSHDHGGGHE